MDEVDGLGVRGREREQEPRFYWLLYGWILASPFKVSGILPQPILCSFNTSIANVFIPRVDPVAVKCFFGFIRVHSYAMLSQPRNAKKFQCCKSFLHQSP